MKFYPISKWCKLQTSFKTVFKTFFEANQIKEKTTLNATTNEKVFFFTFSIFLKTTTTGVVWSFL